MAKIRSPRVTTFNVFANSSETNVFVLYAKLP